MSVPINLLTVKVKEVQALLTLDAARWFIKQTVRVESKLI